MYKIIQDYSINVHKSIIHDYSIHRAGIIPDTYIFWRCHTFFRRCNHQLKDDVPLNLTQRNAATPRVSLVDCAGRLVFRSRGWQSPHWKHWTKHFKKSLTSDIAWAMPFVAWLRTTSLKGLGLKWLLCQIQWLIIIFPPFAHEKHCHLEVYVFRTKNTKKKALCFEIKLWMLRCQNRFELR